MLVFLAHFFVSLFERTRLPDILFLTLIGVIIGPLLGIVQPEDFGKLGGIFTTIALVIILFEGGLEIGIDSLKSAWRGTILITILSYALAFVFVAAILVLTSSLSLPLVLFVAATLAGPAPSVVIPLIRQLRVSDTMKTTMMLESPLGEAICIVTALAILESFKINEVAPGRLIGSLLSSFVMALLIGAFGGYFWSILLDRMRQLRNAILTTPSFVFIVYGFSEFFGFSGPVATLVFGIILGNVETIKIAPLIKKLKLKPMVHTETERLFFGEIVFLMKAFFFVYLGLSIRLSNPWLIGVSSGVVLTLLVSRFVAIRMTATHFFTVDDAMLASVLIPRGIAAAVLAFLPFQLGIPGGDVARDVINSAVILSILVTGVLTFSLEKTSLPGVFSRLFARVEKGSKTRST
jgi:cell volume regulation protein A